jgi:glutaminyl-tRNA synthetase
VGERLVKMESLDAGVSSFSQMDEEATLAKLRALGLEERNLSAVARSRKVLTTLVEAVQVAERGARSAAPQPADESDLLTPTKVSLLYTAVSKLPAKLRAFQDLLFQAIGDGRIDNTAKLEAAFAYLEQLLATSTADILNVDPSAVDAAAFNDAVGAGVVIDDERLRAAVEEEIDSVKSDLLQRGYQYPLGPLMAGVQRRLRFVEGRRIKQLIDKRLFSLLGPRPAASPKGAPSRRTGNSQNTSAAPDANGLKAAAPSGRKVETGTVSTATSEPKSATMASANEIDEVRENRLADDPLSALPEYFEARTLSSMRNTPELLAQQREQTDGCSVVTRFPPEPNAHLHCGHTKAMLLDFGYALKHGGRCILRFDDTNPDTEEQAYIESIIESVQWMGYEPYRITYSSDYFDRLYELALELIRRGKAYVCHQRPEEMARDREEKRPSPWRERPIAENLESFERMRLGMFDEGAAVLRMKIDMQHPNPSMRDPVAYRIKYAAHPHVGDRWCIYPSYDFTHCLVDSLEWVTHSMCTLEFEIRRDSYYWLLEALDMYRPFVFEFSRLNLSHTVLSKRKLTQIIERGLVRGWDDPRMPTIIGMRRRGYRPEAINHFVANVGFSRAENNVHLKKLEACVRQYMDLHAPRRMVVLEPLPVQLVNFTEMNPAGDAVAIQVPNHPKRPEMGTRNVWLTPLIYVERSDFRMQDAKDYYGLAPGKMALLRHTGLAIRIIAALDSRNEPSTIDDQVQLLHAEIVRKIPQPRPRGVLHWASQHSTRCECRLYEPLFRVEDPLQAAADQGLSAHDGWLSFFNPQSERILSEARCEPAEDWSPGAIFQFERVGFFCVDPDTTLEGPAPAIVFNRTVTLRESFPKFA